jgi:mannobiose 2-epimerase
MDTLSDIQRSEIRYLRKFVLQEFSDDILPFWYSMMPDRKNGGFFGRIDFHNAIDHTAEKGLVLNARILWTFSAGYRLWHDERCLELAQRAYDSICSQFFDEKYGGYYWAIDAAGRPAQTKKQIYAQAFVIYAMAEYFLITGSREALERSLNLFELIEKYAFDRQNNGYIEAFSREWGAVEDLRLSNLDMNEKKTMNTHLHVLEGYANLYKIHKEKELGERLKNLIGIFFDRIIDPTDHHFRLFFDEFWNSKSETISYGHDIEGSWLVQEAAEALQDDSLINLSKDNAVRMATAVLPGINSLGGLCHETERKEPSNKGEMEWWAQAEGVVGFLNAWEVSGNNQFLRAATGLARFITSYFLDLHGGEWYYRLNPQGEPISTYDKAGFWKCPYHNSRMCFELYRRTENLLREN